MQEAFLSTLRVLVHLITVILKGILFLFKGNEIVPKLRSISKQWESEVGITDEDYELKKRIREIAIN